MNMKAHSLPSVAGVSQRGFGMIEVMVAVLVLAVGVIGFAGLQTRAVRASGDSYYRTQAMSIAQDLAERMRVNGSQRTYYRTSTLWSGTAATTNCVTTTCSAQAMADYDSATIRANAQALLPQGLVRVEQCKASAVTCIYVAWDGTTPTSGGTATECVDANGQYASTGVNCVMMEVM